MINLTDLFTPQSFIFDSLIGVNTVYAYYWINVLLAAKGKHISRHSVTNSQLQEALREAQVKGNASQFLIQHPNLITAGSISYGSDWKQASIFCRAMESNRPFGCHECFTVMNHPPAYHLHGSNLVVRMDVEKEIGWDIGTHKDNPLIAED